MCRGIFLKTFPKPLTISEEKAFLLRFRDGDMDARDTLIERNMRLVAHVVKKYGMQEREAEDLISVGTIGLIKAVNTYDMDKGSRLATYAAKCIDNAILPQMGLRRRISLLWTKAGRRGRQLIGFWKLFPFWRYFGRAYKVCSFIYSKFSLGCLHKLVEVQLFY